MKCQNLFSRKYILKCRLLKFLSRMLSVKLKWLDFYWNNMHYAVNQFHICCSLKCIQWMTQRPFSCNKWLLCVFYSAADEIKQKYFSLARVTKRRREWNKCQDRWKKKQDLHFTLYMFIKKLADDKFLIFSNKIWLGVSCKSSPGLLPWLFRKLF